MKINDLSKELGITNKELITALKQAGYPAKSHMQVATDDMIEYALENLAAETENLVEEIEEVVAEPTPIVKEKPVVPTKKFEPTDMIPCRSVTPYKMTAIGADRTTVYHWEGYGDVEYVAWKDLQYLRRKSWVTAPKFIIEDADICYQWRHDLKNLYDKYLGIEYPEEFFDVTDEKFRKLLKSARPALQEVVKYTAISMINNENYPTVQKLNIIDELLGTCLKEFL